METLTPAPPRPVGRPRRQTEKDCQPLDAATLRKIVEDAVRTALGNATTAALLDEKQAAAYTCTSLGFLRDCRCYGNRQGRASGPKFLRCGKMIRYKKSDLDAWIEEHVVATPEAC